MFQARVASITSLKTALLMPRSPLNPDFQMRKQSREKLSNVMCILLVSGGASLKLLPASQPTRRALADPCSISTWPQLVSWPTTPDGASDVSNSALLDFETPPKRRPARACPCPACVFATAFIDFPAGRDFPGNMLFLMEL